MKATTMFELKANLKDLKLSAMVREIDAPCVRQRIPG